MKKIVIIGSPGAGKSTFARALGELLRMRVIHLDCYFWLPGWERKSGNARRKILQRLIRKEQWIIEGTYLSLCEPRLIAADTIIFLDLAPYVCLWRLIKRHYLFRKGPRSDIPKGCSDRLMLSLILWVLLFRFQDRRELTQKLENHTSKHIIWLRSRKDVRGFLASRGQSTY